MTTKKVIVIMEHEQELAKINTMKTDCSIEGLPFNKKVANEQTSMTSEGDENHIVDLDFYLKLLLKS